LGGGEFPPPEMPRINTAKQFRRVISVGGVYWAYGRHNIVHDQCV